jgi:hypothetical protein
MQRGGVCPAYFLALLKVFLQELQLEVLALATVQFPWDL